MGRRTRTGDGRRPEKGRRAESEGKAVKKDRLENWGKGRQGERAGRKKGIQKTKGKEGKQVGREKERRKKDKELEDRRQEGINLKEKLQRQAEGQGESGKEGR